MHTPSEKPVASPIQFDAMDAPVSVKDVLQDVHTNARFQTEFGKHAYQGIAAVMFGIVLVPFVLFVAGSVISVTSSDLSSGVAVVLLSMSLLLAYVFYITYRSFVRLSQGVQLARFVEQNGFEYVPQASAGARCSRRASPQAASLAGGDCCHYCVDCYTGGDSIIAAI